ncbi:proteinase-activated receptor 4-like isoform X2 [Sinocyclocheilus grahami]|uniref:proteinase-activated receptor 4-like isoform X2 n=1 Tax=Sinocyclocheilus grahami TaxID=75366 RepID=UPI0007ACC39C|nr:PREDICTED: proteinase-activated receptor 4-like isoform X2 [Sinocyclocheilus grahami]
MTPARPISSASSAMSSPINATRLCESFNGTRGMPLINGTLPDEYKEQIQSYSFTIVVPLVCLVAFFIGLPSNLLALWVLLFRTKKLPSTILLINLTICDLLLLLVLPFRIVYHFLGNNWTFGEPFCRVVIGLLYGNMYGSVVCLALIAMDRYIALVHPFGAKMLRSNKNSVCMSVLVWIVVLAAVVPLLASQQSYKIIDSPLTTCHDALPIEKQEKYFLRYFAILFSICFLLPLLVVLFCYSAVLRTLMAEGQRFAHAIRVTVLMLMVFVVCLLPSNILLLLHYSKSAFDLYVPYQIALSFSTFNSCFDPFIFYYVSKDFRKKIWEALRCSGSDSESSSESRTKITLLSKMSRTEGAA